VNLAAAEMTIQLVEFARTRDRIESTYAERAPLRGHGFDTVRMRDASLAPDEVQTSLEVVATSQGEHGIQSIRRELPELIE
jgi:hypothetical protein